jgi:hypothetical protein
MFIENIIYCTYYMHSKLSHLGEGVLGTDIHDLQGWEKNDEEKYHKLLLHMHTKCP